MIKQTRKKIQEAREDRLTGRERKKEKFTNPSFFFFPAPFSSRPHPSSLQGEGLNCFGFAENVPHAPQLPRRSSPWVGAVLRDEREGEERGKSEPLTISLIQQFNYLLV